MGRSHGSGRACYKGERLPEGTCEDCRRSDAKIQKAYRQTPKGRQIHRDNAARWRMTAKGQLCQIRHAARRRGNASEG